MNVKEYISSGIVESYVLGMVTDTEKAEFEALVATYPEIAEARNQFELALEAQLMTDAKQPPLHLKEKIEQSLSSVQSIEYIDTDTGREETPVRSMGIWKWMAAASIILLALAVYWGIDKNNKYQNELLANKDLKTQLDQTTAELSSVQNDEKMLHSPDVKMAAMHGTTNPAMYATIYWDTTSKDVYLMVNNLPQPASDKQYQLWALLDGKPIDLGVFARQERLLLKMKNVQNAQAFAITLEPVGGSPLPTSSPVVLSKL